MLFPSITSSLKVVGHVGKLDLCAHNTLNNCIVKIGFMLHGIHRISYVYIHRVNRGNAI